MISSQRKMKGVLKKFDSIDHSKNDAKGRNAFRDFLNKLHKNGNRTIDNPNPYGIDLLTLNLSDVVIKAWDVEVRENTWIGEIKFPFSTVNCIERKDYIWRKEQELFNKIPFDVDKNCELSYVHLNNICTRAIIIPGQIVLRYKLVQLDNIKCSGEYIRRVPVNKTFQVKLNNGKIIS